MKVSSSLVFSIQCCGLGICCFIGCRSFSRRVRVAASARVLTKAEKRHTLVSTDLKARGSNRYEGQVSSLKTLNWEPENLLAIVILSLTASVTSKL